MKAESARLRKLYSDTHSEAKKENERDWRECWAKRAIFLAFELGCVCVWKLLNSLCIWSIEAMDGDTIQADAIDRHTQRLYACCLLIMFVHSVYFMAIYREYQ